VLEQPGGQALTGSWSPAGSGSAAGNPEGDKRSVTEIEADEVGASLKWATAKVERTGQRGNGERSSGRERQAERGDFIDQPPF
jgi:single-stranded DNA-binding protein